MKIIAVTSCPVGMAHTYMAASALKKAAKNLGYEIKVETQGSMGIRDLLTKEDIEKADVFIDSADVAIIDQKRFVDIKTYKTTTSKAIKQAEQEIIKAINSIK